MHPIPYTYNDQPVRVLDIDGEPWFVLNDLARVLDIGNARMLSQRLDPDAVSSADVTDALGRSQSTTIVSEAGMYEVVIRSDKPEAVTFRRWITTDVLPSIRKTGGYGNRELTPQELMARAVIAAQDTIRELEATADTQRARLALVEPKAQAFDRWLSSNVDYSVGHVAKALAVAGAQSVGRTRLFVRLAELHWIYRESGQWTPFQAQIDTRRLAVKLGSQLNTRTGEQFSTVTVRITPKGAAKLAVKYGVMPETVAEALNATEEDEAA